MTLLETLRGPHDLARLDRAQLAELGSEIREFLVATVTRTGGHLGPNLGVVELTLALHLEFDSPRDALLFDTGHQTYIHKLLTGRAAGFGRLRARGGLSGYPARAESAHDHIENSHASTALSYADGLTKADALTGRTDRHVVAVVGDGALTGGMAWEALNNIAAGRPRNLVIVVNDNGRSYAPTVGGLAEHLGRLRTTSAYEQVLRAGKRAAYGIPVAGGAVYRGLHGMKEGLKDLAAPQALFGDLGLKYLGPVDGHDLAALRTALAQAREFDGPVIVHALTRKGEGYGPAERDEADRFHGIGVVDPATGRPRSTGGRSWTSVFGEELTGIGHRRPDVVALTAAMRGPVGLDGFAAAHPGRVFDVGIAEQHAVTAAVGMSMGGLHPVVALYATFLNRAFDQVLLDAALHRAALTLVLDRAGITGDDGPSHNGVWDLSVLQVVPGLRVAAPRDAATLRAELREAVEVTDGPTVVRFPKGTVPADIPAVGRHGPLDVLARAGTEPADVLLVAVGATAGACLGAAGRISAGGGPGVTVVDPRWVTPVDPALVDLALSHRLVVTVEDNSRTGGVGSAIAQALADADVDVPVRVHGVPRRFLDHASRDRILEELGLTEQKLAAAVRTAYGRLVPGTATAGRLTALTEGA
ncbi:1-deoxy-D-xylulose-5-phosphate synthase [Streptomyces sp. SCL15-4]|uniref:1-deoxy-D-xylulose-5-phosphate synthase n=1 Tax=Streptomyces sp. SCL15-4 TaxID=2967221 RepID=UPI002965E3F2|nr:1-deoxy-D-xylulose-5-phosphate synthase [Streptomyces sp. SCL15-4]